MKSTEGVYDSTDKPKLLNVVTAPPVLKIKVSEKRFIRAPEESIAVNSALPNMIPFTNLLPGIYVSPNIAIL